MGSHSHGQSTGDSLPQTDPFDSDWLTPRPARPTTDERFTGSMGTKHVPAVGPRANAAERRRSVAEAVEAALRSRPDEPLSLPALYEAVFDIIGFVPAENDVSLAGRSLVRSDGNFFKVGKDAFVWAPDGTPPPPPTPERVAAMIELRRNGRTLDEVGKQFGVTRERVRQLMLKYGGPDSTSVRQAQMEKVQSEEQVRGGVVSSTVRDVLSSSGPLSLDEVASATGIEAAEVARHWPAELAHLRLWGANGTESRWSDDEIMEAIRGAAVYEFPLTANAYGRLLAVGQIQGPSVPRIGQRYGSWTAACKAAGVTAGRAVRNNYESRWSDQDLADIVRQYLLDPGVPNSANRFDEWKRENVPDGPSFQTVRNRFGSWTEAKRRALTTTGSERE